MADLNLCGKPTKGGTPCKKKCVMGGDSCAMHKDPCSCCLEPIRKVAEVVAGECGHTFHRECLLTWSLTEGKLVKSCPMCRGELCEAFQWPKLVPAGRISWNVRSAFHACALIRVIDKTGSILAERMEQRQAEALAQIYDQIGTDYGRIRELKGIKDVCAKEGIFTFQFDLVEVLQLSIHVEMLATFNMRFNLTVLKGHLTRLLGMPSTMTTSVVV